MPSSWSGLPQAPNIIAPRQSGETWTPVRPSGRWFTAPTLARCPRLRASVISVTTDAARSSSSWTWWLRPVARLAVDHAQGPEGVALRVDQRDAGVGDDAHVADGGVVAQHRVLARVVDDQRLAAGDGVLAEGVRQRRLALRRPRLRQPEAALEELAIGVHERDERDRARRAPARRAARWRSKAGSPSESSSPVACSAPSRSGSRAAAAASSSACAALDAVRHRLAGGPACGARRGPPRSRDRPAGPSRRRRA